ncbi:MAG: DUF3108 domain-containing protein [Alphaproteobacteria bacterium]|nr:DUF3108 domain-containing protein [Alphaproteobacteria bacterium]
MHSWKHALAPVLLAVACHGAAAQEAGAPSAKWRLDYEAYIGGFRILSIVSAVRWDADDYDIEVAALTRGVVGWIGDWRGRGVSHGTVDNGLLRPARSRSDTTWRGETRFTDVTYAADGSVVTAAKPSNEEDNRDPVPPQLARNTIDILSALVALVRKVGATGRCDGSFPVYDGRRRYDLSVSDAGEATLEKTSYSLFAGQARKCEAVMRRLAGFWKEKDPRRQAAPDADKPVVVWLAPPKPGAPSLPVRAEAELALGTLVLHLRAAE